MTTTLKQITDVALGLPLQERSELAHLILASIDNDRNDLSTDWDIELKKRVIDIRQGRVQGIPAEDVFAKLEEKYH